MAGRRLSGIWVPIQLDTSRIDADLSKINAKIGSVLGQVQKSFAGTLNTAKLGNAFVDLAKQLGAVNDGANALAKNSVADVQTSRFNKLAQAAGVTAGVMKTLVKEMSDTQAINQQVDGLTRIQKATNKSAEEMYRFAQANTQVSQQALNAFAAVNKLTHLTPSQDILKNIAPQAKEGTQAYTQLTEAVKRYQTAQAATSKVSNIVRQTGLDIAGLKKYSAQLNITEQDIKDYEASQKRASTGGRGVLGVLTPYTASGGVQSAAAAFGVSFGAYGVAELTKSAYQTALQLENLQIAFNSVYKDANKAGAAMEFVKSTSDELGLSILATGQGAKRMFAAAQGTQLQDEVYGIYEAFSSMGAALRLTGPEMDSVFLALSQSISKGKLSAEEMRLQLAERMPGAVQLLAKSMGVTTQQLDKMFEAGTVGLENLVGFGKTVKETYEQGAKDAATGLQAEIGRLQSQWAYLKAEFADTESAAELTRTITEFVKQIKDAAPAIITVSKQLVIFGASAAGAVLLVKGLTALGPIFKTLSAYIVVATTSTQGFTVAATAAGTAVSRLLGPVSIAVTALTAIGITWANWDTTPVTDAVDAMDFLANRAKKAREEVEGLNKVMLGSQKEHIELDIQLVWRNYDSLLNEFNTQIVPNLRKGFDYSLSNISFFDVEGRDKIGREISAIGQEAKTAVAKLYDDLSKVALPEQRLSIIEDFLGEVDLLYKKLELKGVSTEKLEQFEKAIKGITDSASKITNLSKNLMDVNEAINNLDKNKPLIAVKDFESASKSIEAFTKSTTLAKENMLNLEWGGAIANLSTMKEEIDKIPVGLDANTEAGKQAKAIMDEYALSLSLLGARAVSSAPEMKALEEALKNAGVEAGIAKQAIEDLRQTVLNASNMTIQLSVQGLETSLVQSFIKTSLPKNLQASSDVLTKILGLDETGLSKNKAEIEKFTKSLASGVSFDEAISGSKLFANATEEVKNQLKEAFELSKEYYVETTKGSSSASGATKKLSEGVKAYNKLVEESRQLEAKLADSKQVSFDSSSNAYLKELEMKIASNEFTEKEIAKLKEQLEIYKALRGEYSKFLEDQEVQASREKEREDAKDRAAFYTELAERTGEAGLSMQYFNEGLREQIAEWERLEIPQEYIERMEYLKQLDIKTDAFAGLERGFLNIQRSAKDTATLMEEGLGSAVSSVASNFTSFLQNGAQDFNSFANSLIKDIINIGIQLAAQQAVNALFSGIGSLFDVGATAATTATSVASTAGTTGGMLQFLSQGLHSGGIVGKEATFTRSTPLSAFAGAKRFHSGGIIGPSEVPIIAQRGEGVFTREQMANLSPKGGTPTVNVTINNESRVPNSEIKSEVSENGDGSVSVRNYIVSTVRDDVSRGGSIKQALQIDKNRRIVR